MEPANRTQLETGLSQERRPAPLVRTPSGGGKWVAYQATNVRRIVYFINAFPNIIETMIYREIKALRARGYEIHTVSIRRPSPADVPDEARDELATTHYILPVNPVRFLATHVAAISRQPVRYLQLLCHVLLGEHSRLSDRLRTLCHFAEAIAVAPVVKRLKVDHIHAHWAVGSTTCAMVVSSFCQIPFSFTAHAYDIWRDKLLIPRKVKAACVTVTCTNYNRKHLIETYGFDPARVRVVYHGVDVDHFRPPLSRENRQPIVLSVGRLVEQKGFDCLLRSCAMLVAEGVSFRCEIVGDGPLEQDLKSLCRELGIAAQVRFRGRLSQARLIRCYAAADVFALPCVKASDNDRDGIPNVLIEALAMEVPVISTRFSGIPELVTNGENGLLIEPGNVPGLTAALRTLLSDPKRRREMGRAGRKRVLEGFTTQRSAAALDEIFSGLHQRPTNQQDKKLPRQS